MIRKVVILAAVVMVLPTVAMTATQKRPTSLSPLPSRPSCWILAVRVSGVAREDWVQAVEARDGFQI